MFRISCILLFIVFIVQSTILQHNAFSQNSEWKAPSSFDKLENLYTSKANSAEAGQKIFEKVCYKCHGLDGKGNGPDSKDLIPKPKDLTDKIVQVQSDGALYYKISYGKGVMAPYKDALAPRDRWQLVVYIRQLSNEK
ncbi:MAG TPA: cytochrome c [Bacteroidia bacterium]|nr:cytochrome c [Bacteroidia bacterium]